MSPPTNNWRLRRTEHRLHLEAATDITRTKNVKKHSRTIQKTKHMSNTDPTNKPGVKSGAREG
jgi:hypothetical protein